MDVEINEGAKVLKDFIIQNDIKSITVEYSGSGDIGGIDRVVTEPIVEVAGSRLKLYNVAESLILNIINLNFNGAGCSGKMIFSISDDNRLVMTGDHHKYTKYVDICKYDATF